MLRSWIRQNSVLLELRSEFWRIQLRIAVFKLVREQLRQLFDTKLRQLFDTKLRQLFDTEWSLVTGGIGSGHVEIAMFHFWVGRRGFRAVDLAV